MAAVAAQGLPELKQRRGPSASLLDENAALEPTNYEGRRRSLGAILRKVLAAAPRTARGLRHRICDVLSVLGFFGVQAGLWWLTTSELLQPAVGSPVVRWSRRVGYTLYALVLSSWIGILYHGPGRLPRQAQEEHLPELLARAFDVGCWSPRPFSSKGSWCSKCSHWKPAVVHHCSQCGRCGIMMDHHCNFLGQCIGFRNYRCMLVWLVYVQLLFALLAFLLLRRIFFVNRALSIWVQLRLLAFSGLWIFGGWMSSGTLSDMVEQLTRGWASRVQLTKFWVVAQRADRIRSGLSLRDDVALDSRRRLHEALLRVWQRGHVLGPYPAGLLPGLRLVFGEPLSWRWLLPLRPGGGGDPLRPSELDEETCRAWADLAALAPSFEEILKAD